MNNSQAASVRFAAVSKIYTGGVVAVDEVSFTIDPGSLVTLLGPSGCGKTTTLRMIAGLEMASSGSIYINQQDVTKQPATERDVSMVFQSYALFPHMTVGENVAYGLNVSGIDKDEVRQRTQEGLRLVGLEAYEQRLPSELSGGQQQRVAVARALVLKPQVLLFDEPLSNLDAKLRRQVREEIREIQQKLGITSVYVTHDQEEALAVSDQIIVMNEARIAQQGSPMDLYEQPENVFVAGFIGDANLLEVEVRELSGDRAQVSLGAHNFSLPHRGLSPGAAHIAIRPEAIGLDSANASAELNGRISKATYLGNHMEYSVSSTIGDLFVIDPNTAQPLSENTKVGISLAGHGVTLVRG